MNSGRADTASEVRGAQASAGPDYNQAVAFERCAPALGERLGRALGLAQTEISILESALFTERARSEAQQAQCAMEIAALQAQIGELTEQLAKAERGRRAAARAAKKSEPPTGQAKRADVAPDAPSPASGATAEGAGEPS